MGNGLRQTTGMRRRGERIPLVTRVEIRTADDVLFDGQACCTNIGLGGLRVTARRGLAPGTRVYASLRLPSGRCFDGEGRVAWLHTTVHPALLGAPRGSRDEACFGIAFDGLSTHLSKRIVAQRPSTPSKPEPAPVVDVLRALRAWLACLR